MFNTTWSTPLEHTHTTDSTKDQKAKIVIALKKVNTLSARMIKMVEDDVYCIDIMQQNAALMGLLKSTHQMLMEDHLHSCFNDAVHAHDSKHQKDMVEEILKVSKLANR